GTHQGVVFVSITGNTTETASAVLNASATPSSYTQVNISTTGAFTISMNADTSIIHLRGADNVTIDGNNTLTLSNTHSEGMALEFSNDATTNVVKNTIIKGKTAVLNGSFPELGVIVFGKGITTGNDNNIIEFCDIDGTGAAACNIYSAGSFGAQTEENSGNIIRNNKIHDNISNTIAGTISMLLFEGNHDWTIENNSFYHTAAVSTTLQLVVRHLLILPDFVADAHEVKGNFVGGNAPNAAGTLSLTGTGTGIIGYIGIDVETAGTGNIVENNTVKNVNVTYANSLGSFSNSAIFGFVGGFDGTTTINNNTISNINISNTAGTIFFQAIHVNGRTPGAAGFVGATFNITNNTIENIVAAAGGTGHSQLSGMRLETSSSAGQGTTFISNPLFSTSNNTIRNLNAAMNSNQTLVRGISVISTQGTGPTATAFLVPRVDIKNNTIHTLTTNSSLANYAAPAAIGIHYGGAAGVINNLDVEEISENTIYNITASNTGDVGTVSAGILATNGMFEIRKNKVYNIRNAAAPTTAANNAGIIGITVRSSVDTSMVYNNFVSLGDGQTNNLSIYGIINNFDATGPIFVHHNTVVISGAGVPGNTKNTSAFVKGTDLFASTIATPVELKNNIFYNTRTGGGMHYGLANTAATPATGWISSHNNIYSSTAANVARWGAADNAIAVYNTNAADANSKSVTVSFTNVASGDLHLAGASQTDANLHGTPVADVTSDIDNDSRSATTPFMGADEPVTTCVAPAITTPPVAQTVCEGAQLNISVVASGTGLTYQWKKGGTDIGGATSASYTVAASTSADAGSYTVAIQNACGNVTTTAVAVVVNPRPVITVQPAAQAGCNAANVTFNVTATLSSGTISYQWRKDGADVAGATNASYTVAASAATAGNYTVVVSNGNCSVTSSAAALTVTAATAITTQPAAVTACTGNANFSVTATGAALTYQWKFNGTDIPNATNASLSVPVNANTAGNYSVSVTGTCGTVTSNNAALTYTFCTSVSNVDAGVASMVMMPNLVKNETTLRVMVSRTMKVNWNVVDAQGKVVMRFHNQVMPGKNDIKLFLGQLSNGTYQLQGITDKGVTSVVRFVKM
ncbi:MAG: beta strand repeat-containing protein, partial [Flavisolibacter sp.]